MTPTPTNSAEALPKPYLSIEGRKLFTEQQIRAAILADRTARTACKTCGGSGACGEVVCWDCQGTGTARTAPVSVEAIAKVGYMPGFYEDGLQVEFIDASRAHDGMLLYAASPLPEAAKAEPDEQVIPGDGVFGGMKFKIDQNMPPNTIEMRGANRVRMDLATGEISTSPPQAEPVSTAKSVSDLIATHQVPKAKRMAELVSTAGAVDDVRLPIEKCIQQFRFYADNDMLSKDAKHQLNFCADFLRDHGPAATPLAVTAPDMSDEQIDEIWSEVLMRNPMPQPAYRAFARALRSQPKGEAQ